MSEFRVATFDCYGTLIDWEGGVGSFLYELARRHEHDPPPARELRERWEALQFERIQEDWRSYREILADSLAATTLLLDPGLFVLGGGLAQAGPRLLAPLESRLADRLTFRPPPPLVTTELGDQAAVHGAALLAARLL